MAGDSPLLAVMVREVKRVISSPLAMILTLVAPLAAFAIFASLFITAVPESLPVAVVDRDRSELSRTICRLVDASPAMALVRVPDEAAGRRALVSGQAYGLLVIPEGFAGRVKRRQAPVTPFYINNQLMLPAGVVKRAMMKIFATLSAGVKMKQLRALGLGEAQAEDRLFGIHAASHVLFNPNLNYRWFLLAAMGPFMLKIFTMCATVWALGSDAKEGGTALWQKAACGKAFSAILGKCIPYGIWFTVLMWAFLAFLFGPMGLPRPAGLLPLMVGFFFVCGGLPGHGPFFLGLHRRYGARHQFYQHLRRLFLHLCRGDLPRSGHASCGAPLARDDTPDPYDSAGERAEP